VNDLAWLFVAVMVVWVAIGGYLVTLSSRQSKLEARISDITSGEEEAS
jgi:CcmD family protein